MARDLDNLMIEQGISLALWPTLMCLCEEYGVTQKEISQKARVESSTTTRTLDKLEKLGLAERRPDPKSRRSLRIYLTKKGRKLEPQITPLPMQVNQKYLAGLAPEERNQLIKLLQKSSQNIDV
jgi:DNA-binding MarR family transcriptional regulator